MIGSLKRKGELWEAAPGLVGLRGDAHHLFRAIERLFEAAAYREAPDGLRTPPGIAFDLLARASYFESFPHWLTAAAHLGTDETALESIARDPNAGQLAAHSLCPAEAALSPALCYHAYGLHADTTLEESPSLLTMQGTCWRRETRFAPLERAWAFTMREIVCMGSSEEVEAFRVWRAGHGSVLRPYRSGEGARSAPEGAEGRATAACRHR